MRVGQQVIPGVHDLILLVFLFRRIQLQFILSRVLTVVAQIQKQLPLMLAQTKHRPLQ